MVDTENAVQSDEGEIPMDIEIQYHILNMMMKDENFLVKCCAYLKEEYFENVILGWFFKAMSAHHKAYRQPMEAATVRNEILKFPPEERPRYEVALDRILTSSYRDESYLMQQLTKWLKSRRYIKLHHDMQDLFNANQYDNAYNVTEKSIKEIMEINFMSDKVLNFDNVPTWIEQASKSGQNRIPLGIPEIDAALLGGLKKQALTTLLGVTNSGKTIAMINIAVNAMKAGYKVLYIYHENDDQTMGLRFLSCITKIPYNRFYTGGIAALTDEERMAICSAQSLFNNRLVLKPLIKYGTTIDELVSYARTKKTDWNYDLLIDDYAQMLKTETKTTELRHVQNEVYRGLGSLAGELEIAIVSAAQGNRASFVESQKGKKLIGLGDISECFDICMASECVLTITRSQEDQVNDRAYILLAKQREGLVNVGVECRTDMKRICLYDRNLGMSSLRLSENHEIIHSDDTDPEETLKSSMNVQSPDNPSVLRH